MFVPFIPSHIAGLIISCTQTLTMERALRLLDVIYASAEAREIHNLRSEICRCCKIHPQDCLMMTEEEGWDMHGLTAMERVKSHHTVWHEFLEVLEIINMQSIWKTNFVNILISSFNVIQTISVVTLYV